MLPLCTFPVVITLYERYLLTHRAPQVSPLQLSHLSQLLVIEGDVAQTVGKIAQGIMIIHVIVVVRILHSLQLQVMPRAVVHADIGEHIGHQRLALLQVNPTPIGKSLTVVLVGLPMPLKKGEGIYIGMMKQTEPNGVVIYGIITNAVEELDRPLLHEIILGISLCH